MANKLITKVPLLCAVGTLFFGLIGCDIAPVSTILVGNEGTYPKPIQEADQEATPDKTLREIQREFNQQIRPLIETSCGDCHWGDDAEAELDLEKFETIDQVLDQSKKWKKIVEQVVSGKMPPEGSAPLEPDERKELVDWVDNVMDTINCTDINPGRVTLRRLNATEYRNTIRDLLGVDYKQAIRFPGDDIGYGFDNIADVLSLPPILMEKYLEAAERISSEVFAIPKPKISLQIPGAKFKPTPQTRVVSGGHLFFANSTIKRSVNIKSAGRYRINVSATGDQVGKIAVEMGVEIGGVKKKLEVFAENPRVVDHEFELELPKGKHRIKLSFLNDFYQPSMSFDRNLLIEAVEIKGPLKRSASYQKFVFLDPGETQAEQLKSARKILKRYMSRAFRRPAKDHEVNRLAKLYRQSRDAGQSFDEAMALPLQAVIVSPSFLFKVEAPLAPNQQRELNAYELATSLSYFLWSTMPDDRLFAAAHSGELLKPDVYRAEVERMLRDKKAKSLVENFAAQWLQLRSLREFNPDPDLFPGVDTKLKQEMVNETKLFFGNVLSSDSSIFDLLNAKHSYLNESLARHYGVEDVKGNEFRRVDFKDAKRGGLLTQASILTLTSNPTRTSPVKRGKWIQENLLGEEPTFPDPDIMDLEAQPELTGTLRQRMVQHRTDPQCAACHETMDALGFALENYDAVGKWRERDEDLEIDSSAELPDGTRFSGARELQKLVQNQMSEKFVRCLTEKMLVYSLGRGLEYYDECVVDEIMKRLAENEYRVSELVIAVAESVPFKSRRGEKAEVQPEPAESHE